MSVPSQQTLAEIGEFGLVSALAELFPQGDPVLLGPGDDAAVVAVPDGRVVVSTDLHVDTRHFRRDWATAEEIGHKVAAANLSDINAMGGRATRAHGRPRRTRRPARLLGAGPGSRGSPTSARWWVPRWSEAT